MSRIYQAVEALVRGRPVIITDDSERENEGDLVLPAQLANEHNLTFCLNHGKGLMCIPCMPEKIEALGIPLSPSNDKDPLKTPFTVSVDAVKGTTTGMSVQDRLKTISVFLKPSPSSEDLQYPGHMFPLRARPGLLQERRGHTESSLELMKIGGFEPVAIIIEIMNDNGTMKRGAELEFYAKVYDLKIVTIEEIYQHVYNSRV